MNERKSANRTPVVVGTGLVALDLVYNMDEKATARQYAGGTCGNVLAILAFLGWEAFPVARLRPGAAAERIRSDLSKWGVRPDFLARRRTGSTPIIVQRILRGPDGMPYHRFTWSCPSCGAILPSYKPVLSKDAAHVAELMPDPSVFFFDRVSRGALMLAEASAARGAVVVFEPSGIGDPKLFGEAVQIAHVLKYSRERMIQIEAIEKKERPRLEIETLGDEGLRYRCSLNNFSTKTWTRVPAFPVRRLRDAAGSGDWCTAGVISRLAVGGLSGLLKASGPQVAEAIQYGQALATWNCEFEGARGGMYQVSHEKFATSVLAIQGGEVIEHQTADDPDAAASRSVCPSCRRGKVPTEAKRRGPIQHSSLHLGVGHH